MERVKVLDGSFVQGFRLWWFRVDQEQFLSLFGFRIWAFCLRV